MDPGLLSRRDFLKVGGVWAASFAAIPLIPSTPNLPPEELTLQTPQGRVTIESINVYTQPDFSSARLGSIPRDTLVCILDEVESPFGPSYNRRWYRLSKGYIHSARIQRVDQAHLNPPLEEIPQGGQLGEISVPFANSLRRTRASGWTPLYRLYFQSTHWITSLVKGPNGEPWYGLTDDRLHVEYCVPAAYVRPIPSEELLPISPDVPPEMKRIEVSTRNQTLTAYEGDRIVLATKISSGLPGEPPTPHDLPTETPTGTFHIQVKAPSRHMGDGNLTSDPSAYELPGVPWVSFFHIYGIGFHGTYWHDNFGRKMSHGCVNMRTEEAKWLYRWSTPEASPPDWYHVGRGTRIIVYDT